MTDQPPYPVIEERPLQAVRRRVLLGGKRDRAELPVQKPGTMLVFEVNGRHQAYREGRHLRGGEDAVVEAVSVTVVDVRERSIWVELVMPSNSAADDFLVGACFRCRVTDPETVAAAGLTDVADLLRQQLCRDTRLMASGVGYSVDAINAFREYVTARLVSLCELDPPTISGMSIRLSSVQITTPDQLREYERQVRDGRRRRHITGEDVEWLEELSARGPATLDALAISRRELTAADASSRAHEIQAERERIGVEVMRMLHEDKLLDRIPVDATRLVDSVIERVTGVGPATALPSGPTQPARSIAAPGHDDDDDDALLPDDDDQAR